jgi:hypothetical protein
MNKRLSYFTGVLLVSLVACAYGAEEANRPVPPSPTSAEAAQFGYASPEAALSALRERPDVAISQQGGWTIVDDKANFALWSFTPPDHPAHPAAIKRVMVQSEAGDISVVMTAKCGGPKEACDKLISEFRAMNDSMRQRVQSRLKGQ